MANPARKYDERPDVVDPVAADPYAPIPAAADPVARDPRIAANDPYVNNQVVQRGTGNGVIIAAVLLVLAVVAFFIFGPGVSDNAVAPADPATNSEPATPAPDAMAPAAPADPATPAPDAMAPADPAAPAPDASAPATAPTGTAPTGEAPAETAPATPAPAPAQ